MTMRTVLALSLLVLVAACGTADPVARDPSPDDPTGTHGPLVVVDGEVQVSCGGDGLSWAPSAMSGSDDEDRPDEDEVTAALERVVEEAPMDAPVVLHDGVEDDDWFVLAEDDDNLTLATGPWTIDGPAQVAQVVGLEREADGWRVGGWGGCNLAPVLAEDASWVTVSWPPGGVDHDSTELEVGVTELACSGARDPRPFLNEPYLVETTESVTVYWTTVHPQGANTCPGRSPDPMQLTLGAPLGDRELLDGSTYPPQPVGPAPF